MGREALAPGQVGEPWIDKHDRKRAHVKFRAWDGTRKQASATGRTVAEAKAAAVAKAQKRLGVSADLGPRQTMTEVYDSWIARAEERALAIGTRSRYIKEWKRHVKPRCGGLIVGEVRLADLQRVIREVEEVSVDPAHVKAVLNGMMDHAARQGWAESNPLRGVRAEIDRTKRKRKTSAERALETPELVGLLLSTLEERETAGYRRPAIGKNLRKVVLTILGTSLRINEVLGLTWRNVALSGDVPMLVLDRALLQTDGLLVKEARLAERPKTKAAVRMVALPPQLVEMLKEHRKATPYRRLDDPVFCTKDGRWLDDTNLRNTMNRVVRGVPGLEDVSFHGLRATVATAIERRDGAAAAAAYLGQAGASVTIAHYIAKGTKVVDAREALEWLIPDADAQ